MEFSDLGINIGNYTKGQVKTKCPRCSHTRKKKSDPCLSVNIDEGVWKCHNCGWSGSLKHTEWAGKKEKPQVFTYDKSAIPEDIIDWFNNRGITRHTLEVFNVSYKNGYIQFPFYNGGDVLNIKGRTLDKKFKLEQGGSVLPWHYNDILRAQGETLVITEGEIDALSVYEVMGTDFRVISMPNGANLSWLENSWKDLDGVSNFIIASDGDEKGIAVRDELSGRLGRHRCSYVEYPEGTKDLNEVLVKLGKEEVSELILNPTQYPIDGLVGFEDYSTEVLKYWEHGYPEGERVGPVDLRDHIAFQKGQLTTITGTPGSGKSEFIDQLLVWLMNDFAWKTGVCSYENQPVPFHVSKLVSKIAKAPLKDVPLEILGKVMDQVDRYFKFYDLKTGGLTIDDILNKGRELVGRFGIDALLIDPYNYINHDTNHEMSETNYIAKVLLKVTAFAKSHNVHVFFIAHPTKMKKLEDGSGNYEPPNLYSISGSAHWYNMTDNGITVWRDFNSNKVIIYITKVRFDWNGRVGSVEMFYNTQKRTYEDNYSVESFDSRINK